MFSDFVKPLDIKQIKKNFRNLLKEDKKIKDVDRSYPIYTVTFSSDLGDVPNILEVLGLVNYTFTETVTGSPSGNRIQLQIQNSKTNLFTVSNKQSVRINSLI